jgi:hypothetical protein
MSKESIVEIPRGSGNRYRYAYEDGETLYRGPVGSAPPLDEDMFLEQMVKPPYHTIDDDYIDGKYYEFGEVDPRSPEFPAFREKLEKWAKAKGIVLSEAEYEKPRYVAMLDGEPYGALWVHSRKRGMIDQTWASLGLDSLTDDVKIRENFISRFTEEMMRDSPDDHFKIYLEWYGKESYWDKDYLTKLHGTSDAFKNAGWDITYTEEEKKVNFFYEPYEG